MLSYCLKCRSNTEIENPRVAKKQNGKPILLSKCTVCGSKKLRFINKQEAGGALLGCKSLLNKIPILRVIF